MTTCARCGRCSRRRGPISGRSIGRARSASSICGSRARRSRSGTARPAGLGRGRVSGLLARRRRRADLLASRPRICCSGSGAVCGRWAALPQTLVWDRQSGLHAGGGRPTVEFAAFCGAAEGRLALLRAARPAGQGRASSACRTSSSAASSPAAASPTSSTSSCSSTTGSTSRANPRMHKTLRCRPIDRLIEERAVMAPLPAAAPDTDRRWVLRVAAGSRICASTPATTRWTRGWSAAASRSRVDRPRGHSRSRWTAASWPAATARSFARHRTITALEHARALKTQRHERRGARARGRGPLAGRL